jgi:hypothetical protein
MINRSLIILLNNILKSKNFRVSHRGGMEQSPD